MQSTTIISKKTIKDNLMQFFNQKWDNFGERQKKYAKKLWSIISYKWRWQIAMNIPYFMFFILDKTVPQIHEFDMALLATITSRLPIPTFVSGWFGLG